MLAINLIEQLMRAESQDSTTTYFFCQDSDARLNSLEAMVKGLIFGLVREDKGLLECIRRRWDDDKRDFKINMSAWTALWDILLDMLDRCKGRRIYVVIDALDECGKGHIGELLRCIVRTGLGRFSNIKWLMTSRPLDSAEQHLLGSSDQVLISLDLNSSYVAKAVEAYIKSRVQELSRLKRYGKALQESVEATLVQRAEGTFLWVSLVCDRLEEVSPEQVSAVMNDLPPGLPAFFNTILQQISGGDAGMAKGCMHLLKVMLQTYRPLNTQEISMVACLGDDEDGIEALTNRCASFVRRQDDKIEFVHQSARDYLSGAEGQAALKPYPPYGHREAAVTCLNSLLHVLKPDLLGLVRPNATSAAITRVKDEGGALVLTAIDYAAVYWTRHFVAAIKSGEGHDVLDLQEHGQVFMQTRLLEWLECLTLMNSLPQAVIGLRAMEAVVEVSRSCCQSLTIAFKLTRGSQTPSVLALLRDALRFLSRHYQTIDAWPLQVYSSAVVFSPRQGLLRKQNLDKALRWLKQLPQVETE